MQDQSTFDRNPAEKRLREETMDLIIKERQIALEERKERIREKNLDFQIRLATLIEEKLGGLNDDDKIYFKQRVINLDCFENEFVELHNDGLGDGLDIEYVCHEMGIDPKRKCLRIGEVLAEMWKERYPGQAIPQREFLYRGRRRTDNAYYERDRDLIEKAIRQVCCP